MLMGIYQSVSSIGSLLGGLIGGIILDLMGFKPAALILAAGTALGIPIVFTLKDGNEESESKTSEAPINLKTILGSTRILSIGIGAMLSSLFMGSIIVSTLSLYLAESFGREGVQIYGTVVGIATLTGFLLMFRLLSRTLFGPIFGPLSDILGRKKTIMILFLMGSISLAFLGLSNSLLIAALAVVLIFTSAAGLGVVLTTEVSDIASEESEASHYVLSAYTNWTDLGSALGPLTAYILLSGVSFRSLFLGASIILFLFTLLRVSK
jgi:MFS family permease